LVPGVASPDGREFQRLSCRDCGYTVAAAIWCQDPQCCDQDRGRFIGSLVPAEEAREVPVFAVRYDDPARAGSPAAQVTVWRAGDITPVFTGPIADAIRIQLRHECRGHA
jgi:hypothetical protein